VAIQESQSDEKILGVARVISGISRRRAEFTVVTGDPWQGKGIGAKLLRRCLKIAKEHGTEAVSGSVLYENTQMLVLGKKLGFRIKKAPESGVYELNLDLI
jgi:acetyltransferase